MLAKPGVHHQYSGKTIELGLECGKYCGVCTLVIINPGDSDIIRSMSEQTGEKQNMKNLSLIKLARACSVSYTHLTLPTTRLRCRSRWSPYH